MATVRFIGIGDLHLAPGPRNRDRLDALDYVIRDAMESQDGIHPTVISAWLWAGDLDDAKMSIDDRNALVERVLLMAAVAPVVIVKGNHDVEGDLDFLAHLDTKWPVSVITSPQVITLTLAQPDQTHGVDAALFCLPYPSKANIVAAGFAHHDIGRVSAESLDLICMEAGAKLDDARRRGLVTGVVGHITISGAVASTGQPQIGGELEISPAHLTRLGHCFKVFGHIHRSQRVGDAWYAGSLSRTDFGETEPKGYLVIECHEAKED